MPCEFLTSQTFDRTSMTWTPCSDLKILKVQNGVERGPARHVCFSTFDRDNNRIKSNRPVLIEILDNAHPGIPDSHSSLFNIDRDGSSRQGISPSGPDSGMTESGFLDYTPVRIFNPFLASCLNNWRAIRLYIKLIEEPMWELYDGSGFVCAVDLCRTYGALGSERHFLGAEKSVGLYLAGVVFGGPTKYAVASPFNTS